MLFWARGCFVSFATEHLAPIGVVDCLQVCREYEIVVEFLTPRCLTSLRATNNFPTFFLLFIYLGSRAMGFFRLPPAGRLLLSQIKKDKKRKSKAGGGYDPIHGP